MSEQPTQGGPEPDASRISPLLGTNRLQQGVDRFSKVLDRVSDSLSKVADRTRAMATPSAGGVGNPSTLGGGRPLGGGATFSGAGQRMGAGVGNGGHGPGTFVGMPTVGAPPGTTNWGLGAPSGPPPPKFPGMKQWTRNGQIAGAAWGVYAVHSALEGSSEKITTNTTAQLMARSSNMGAGDIRSLITRNNYTAISSTDAMQGGSNLMRAGYAIGSSGYNSLVSQAKNYRVMDPTASFADATARMTAGASVGTGNFLLSRGVATRDARGNLLNPTQTATSILRTAGLNPNTKWNDKSIAASWDASGKSTMLINALAQTDPEMAKLVQDQLHGIQNASKGGMSMSAYQKAVAAGDWSTLSKHGITKTDVDTSRDVNAGKMNLQDNTAMGFSKGLQTANAALEQFNAALDKITHGPLGDLIGAGQGSIGSNGFTSGMVGTGAAIGGHVLGGMLARRAVTSIGAAGGTRAAAAAAGRAGAGWVSGGLGAIGAGSAAVGAGVVGAGVAAAGVGAGLFNAATSTDERAARQQQIEASGLPSWLASANAFSETFANSISFGAYDAHHMGNSTYGGTGGVAAEGNGGGPSTGGSKSGKASASSGIAPVTGFKVSAPYGHYSNGKPHHGVDFACPVGTPVRANRSGKVIKAGWDNGGFGNHVRIDSGDGLIEIYGHMSKVNVKVGDSITAGALLGLSGDTGNVTGPHLHFEVRKGGSGIGNAVDPMPYLSGSGGVSPGTPAGVSGSMGSGSVAQAKSSSAGPGGASAGIPWGVNEAELVARGLSASASAPGGGPGADGASSGSTGAASTPASGATGPLRGILGKAGFSGSALATAYAVMMAESGGNRMSHNTNARTGDNSYGLFQINMLGGMGPERRARYHLGSNDALFDPLTNAKVAFEMSHHGTDWHDWSTYKSGAYKKYLGGQTKKYDVGSTNVDVDQTARVHKGEMIIDPVTSDEIRKALSTNAPTSIFGKKGGGGGGISIAKVELHTAHSFVDSAATDLAQQFIALLANNSDMTTLREG